VTVSRRFKDCAFHRRGNGAITFGRAFKVGILIALIACAVYVIAWEIVYFNFMPDFMARFKEFYALINIGIPFLEVFPVGLIVMLVSAGPAPAHAG